jgi:hypothetical protein
MLSITGTKWVAGAAVVAAAIAAGASATRSLANGAGGAAAAARPGATATATDARAATGTNPQPSIRIDSAKELMITHLSVVEDPLRTTWPAPIPTASTSSTERRFGVASTIAVPRPHPSAAKWTFGKLMANMAGANDAPTFVLNWLRQWETDQTINGFTAAARPAIGPQIINPWLAASGGSRLDLSKAPFRLLAIVNRVDLRKTPSYSAGNAGEGRFVFCATDRNGNALPFTVIFEYELPARNIADVKAWASAWHELGSLPFGDTFNAKLEAITDRFAGRGVMPAKINGSAINQVRTNEIALGSPWELREFRLASRGGQLVQVTCKQEVDVSFFNTSELSAFINGNAAAIIAGRHQVPSHMVAAAAPEQLVLNAPRINGNLEARHKLALNTCSGCHFRETGTGFTHVDPRARGQEARLSGFLTGITANDPITGTPHTFNDLAARADDLRHVLTTSTPVLMVEPTETRTH